MKIGTRISLGFVVVILFMVAMAAAGLWELRKIANSADRTLGVVVHEEFKAEQWKAKTMMNGERAVFLAFGQEPANEKMIREEMSKTSKEITVIQKWLNETVTLEKNRKLMEEVGKKRKIYVDIRKEVNKLRGENKINESRDMLHKNMIPALKAYVGSIDAFVNSLTEESKMAHHDIMDDYRLALIMILSLLGAALILSAIIAFRLIAGIVRPLNEATRIAAAVANGDLTNPITHTDSNDQTGLLMRALKDMEENLTVIVSEIR
ncbi:MAG: MCP four helix bundle domain-containing protein, partial [Burkholderiaceae bacterium]|nr:MCP four helix bundle domain-containing protein [Burkholderiaceae bacterium]